MATDNSEVRKSVVERVLEYWFGTPSGWYDTCKEQLPIWWSASADVDAQIQENFAADVELALAGKLDNIIGSEEYGLKGDLAVVILLDQLTRSIFRGTGKAFSGDEKALAITLAAVEQNDKVAKELMPVERHFLYMPLMHSEDVEISKKSSSVLSEMLAEMKEKGEEAEDCIKMIQGGVDFAKKHTEILERFGRYPHRNSALGRTSTPEEEEYLKTANTFGQ